MAIWKTTVLMASVTALIGGHAVAAAPLTLTINGHHFTPGEATAPAGERFVIQVRNLDPTPEEFESYDLKVEKILAPHATILVSVGPQKPGVYKFFGDYNPGQAVGHLRVTAPVLRK